MLATRQFATSHAEFVRRDVVLVRVFHSPATALVSFAHGPHALPFTVLADPAKSAYRSWGVSSSWRALFSRAALGRIAEARSAGLSANWRDAWRDGIGGAPADFLIAANGNIAALHYGLHFADSITPAEALRWIDAAAASPTTGPR
ncbi:MAG: hypothetical protein EXS13_12110 [Planctomycetes bacterium]|nr:hypothetical protein [Planctomycetota bacterium]